MAATSAVALMATRGGGNRPSPGCLGLPPPSGGSMVTAVAAAGLPSGYRSSLPLQSSPTLARVHRATLRLEGVLPPSHQNRGSYVPTSQQEAPFDLLGSTPPTSEGSPGAALKRGVLLTLRPSAIFKRWKERYFLLTSDYLSCFKLTSGPSTMGAFIYKVRLSEVRNVTWTNSRSDAMGTVSLELGAPLSPSYDEAPTSPGLQKNAPTFSPAETSSHSKGTVVLRAPPGVKDAVLEDWFELIEESVESSKSRRAARTASFSKIRQ